MILTVIGVIVLAGQLLAAQQSVEPDCGAVLTRGDEALQHEQFSAAIAAAETAQSVCTDKTKSLLLLARAQMLSQQFEESLRTLSLLLTPNAKNADALLLKGQVLYLDNRDNQAGQAFHDAVNAAPEQAAPHYWLGKFLYEKNEPAKAIDEFQSALHADPGFYRAYDGLGLAYAATGDNDKAVQSYLKALDLTKDGPRDYDDALADLAELLLRLGKNAQAFDVAAEAADRKPSNPRNLYLAGRAAEEAGKYQASLPWLKRAADLDPAYPDPHYVLARVYRRLNQNEQATAEAALYQKLAASAPKVRR
jgi:tetratricopeptide (TPR) repeat protein